MDQTSVTYNNILEKLREIESNELDKETLHEIVKVLEIIKSIDEIEVDALKGSESFMKFIATSNSGRLLAKCLNIELKNALYKGKDLKLKLSNKFHMTNNAIDHLHLLKIARSIINPTPDCTFMPFIEPTEVPIKIERQKGRILPKKIITNSRVATENQEENVANFHNIAIKLNKILKVVYEKLKEPLDYYKFVIDTSSFKNTIDNIFYTSFLCNSKKAKLFKDESGTLNLIPLEKNQLTESEHQGKIIVGITMDEWKNFKFEKGYVQQYESMYLNYKNAS